jgi:hypothetical protein
MWVVGLGVAALPFVLMVAFHGADAADSRGRRTDRTWRVRNPSRGRTRKHESYTSGRDGTDVGRRGSTCDEPG